MRPVYSCFRHHAHAAVMHILPIPIERSRENFSRRNPEDIRTIQQQKDAAAHKQNNAILLSIKAKLARQQFTYSTNKPMSSITYLCLASPDEFPNDFPQVGQVRETSTLREVCRR